MTADAVVV